MTGKLIPITELTQRFHLTSYTVNHYTNIGLLRVAGRKRNRRLYDEEAVRRRLAKMTELISQGYPLQLISQKLNSEGA